MRTAFLLGAACAGIPAAAVAAYVGWRMGAAARRKRWAWRSLHTLQTGAPCIVRAAEPADVDNVVEFVYKLAEADGGVEQVTAGADTIRRAFAAGDFNALLVELDIGAMAAGRNLVVAMAVVQDSFRTYTGPSIYLQDLVVDEAHRGSGIGTLLIRVLAAVASSRGCDTVFWESHAGNDKANRFYGETTGAEHATGTEQLLTWKLRGSALDGQARRLQARA